MSRCRHAAQGARCEPTDCHDAAMPMEPPQPDLSNACWRCQHWGGLVAGVHAECTRLNGTLQASPATGCVFWKAGAGGELPPDWLPPGFGIVKHSGIWGAQVSAAEHKPMPSLNGRPGPPTDADKWDRDQERDAWRVADSLMARARRP